MANNQTASYTTEEIADLLKVSKLTIYDLIKKGELRAYRVGRQMRIDATDLDDYKNVSKSGGASTTHETHAEASSIQVPVPEETVSPSPVFPPHASQQLIISGQDISLDLLASAIEKSGNGFRPLRSYTGSLNSLIDMYKGSADIVSTHLFDGDTGTYNIPYIKRILSGHSYIVINLLSRKAGLFVQKNNPKKILSWNDFKREDVKMVNREIGSGARVLLDEMLKLEGITGRKIEGYDNVEMNHIAVASKVLSEMADVGVGIERAATLIGVEFIPLIQERYDLVLFKTAENRGLRDTILSTLRSEVFQNELSAISGYDLALTGAVMYETD